MVIYIKKSNRTSKASADYRMPWLIKYKNSVLWQMSPKLTSEYYCLSCNHKEMLSHGLKSITYSIKISANFRFMGNILDVHFYILLAKKKTTIHYHISILEHQCMIDFFHFLLIFFHFLLILFSLFPDWITQWSIVLICIYPTIFLNISLFCVVYKLQNI